MTFKLDTTSEAARERLVTFPTNMRPQLIVYVDAEEEFDWSRPFSSAETRVSNLLAQEPALDILARFYLKPTFLLDFPVADQELSAGPIRRLLERGIIEIGAQMHPWVTPPYGEVINEANSYPGNLEASVELSKLECLTELLLRQFGVKPVIYRAGRYGLGPNTARSLEPLDYKIDCSVYPGRNFATSGGPDFTGFPGNPYWVGSVGDGLLEIPLTAGFLGMMHPFGNRLNGFVRHSWGRPLRLPSVLRHLGLLEQSWLTPEGVSVQEAKRLTRHLLAQGKRVFSITYHSPSLVPGNTPYVRTNEDLARFLNWLAEYFEFFFSELGGTASTPLAIYDLAKAASTRPEAKK